LLQALGAADIQRLLAEIDDDIVWRLPSLGHVGHGRAAVTEELQQTAGRSRSPAWCTWWSMAFVVALYDVESRIGGTAYEGPGVAVLRYENDKIVEFSGYRADQFPR